MGENGDKPLEDIRHERAVWKVEHWGWTVFGLILLAALLGVFGEGPVGRAKAQNSQLLVEYDRFARYQARAHLKIHLRSPVANSMPALSIARDFLDRVEVQHITPQPQRVRMTKDALIYIFDAARTNENAMITLQYKPARYGKTPVTLALVDGAQLQFTQFFYP